jgi:hypothetical protein
LLHELAESLWHFLTSKVHEAIETQPAFLRQPVHGEFGIHSPKTAAYKTTGKYTQQPDPLENPTNP